LHQPASAPVFINQRCSIAISPWAEGIVLQVDYVILCPGLSKGNPKNTKREEVK